MTCLCVFNRVGFGKISFAFGEIDQVRIVSAERFEVGFTQGFDIDQAKWRYGQPGITE